MNFIDFIYKKTKLNNIIKKHHDSGDVNVKLKEAARLHAEIAEENSRLKELLQTIKDRVKVEEELNNALSEHVKILSEHVRTLKEKTNKYSEQIMDLQHKNSELSLMIPGQMPYKEIMGGCSHAAWYGLSNSRRTFVSQDNKYKLIFEGVVYEPCYEDFTAGCCVYAYDGDEKTTLYSIDSRNVAAYKNEVIEEGSIENIESWLKKVNCGFKEI